MFQTALNKKMLKCRVAKMLVFSAAMLVMGLGTPAFAALQSIGPIDQATGYPTTVTDTNGVTLGQCLDPFHCAAAPADLPFATQPMSFPNNWPDEIFWYTADSVMGFASPNGGGGSAILVMAVEGAFGNGPVAPGDQIMFSRIRLKVSGLIAGAAYTATHPYGVINFTADAAGGIFTTDDCGMGIPGDPGSYARILDCPIGPYLTVLNPAPPAGFIGSINDLVTVTGSPFGTNVFRIEGPGLGLNGISTDLFTITGKISTAPQQSNVLLEKATYTRPTIGTPQAQVFSTAANTNSILTVSSAGGAAAPLLGSVFMEQVVIPGNPTAVPPVPATATKKFFANIDLTADFAGNLPTSIIISDTTLNPPLNARSASLVDVVNITAATYNQATGLLTVNASSSDEVTPLSLVVLDLPAPNNIVVGGTLTAALNAPIDRVTIQSSQGGVATANVVLVGPGTTNFMLPDFPAPVAVIAGLPSQEAFVNTRVDLSAGASTGTIASYSWVQTSGPPVAISNPFTSDIHFIYPDVQAPAVAPTYLFEVTVTGPGGTSVASVTITGVTVPPIIPDVTAADAKLGKDEWKVKGQVTPTGVPGATIVALIVTDSFGTTADLIAASGGIAVDIDTAGLWAFSSKGVPLTTGLAPGQWTMHAVSSTGHIDLVDEPVNVQ